MGNFHPSCGAIRRGGQVTPTPPSPPRAKSLQSASVPSCQLKASEHEHVLALMERLPPTEVVDGRWFSYNDDTGCWEVHPKEAYLQLALDVQNPAGRKVAKARAIVDHLENRLRKKLNFYGMVRPVSFDTVQINTLNKVLTVSPLGIKVVDHDLEFRFTRSLDVIYEAGSVNQPFLDALDCIISDKLDQKLLQKLWANAFIPDGRYAVCGNLYGESRSGKDTIFGPFMALFGPPERGLLTNYSIAQISEPKAYFLADLQFAAVNVCTELNSREVEDSSIFKALVAGGSVPARMIWEKPFNMVTACKLFALSNVMPDFRDGTDAERQRMRFIRCMAKFDKIDVLVKERLKVAHPGTLNWILEALQEMLANPGDPMPYGGEASQEVHARFFASNDPINNFVTTCCVMEPATSCMKADLRAAFTAYASDNDLPDAFTKGFFKRLYKRFTALKPKRAGARSMRVQVINGIRLNDTGEALCEDAEPPKTGS